MDKSELYDKALQIENQLGTARLLDNILQSMTSDELEDTLRYIDRCWDTNVFND